MKLIIFYDFINKIKKFKLYLNKYDSFYGKIMMLYDLSRYKNIYHTYIKYIKESLINKKFNIFYIYSVNRE